MAERVIALAGNPNVGKSTVFNSLTGMRRHTGNWSGKTVDTAAGRFRRGENEYILVDLPGTYSLLTHSAEEEVARDFLGGDDPDGVVIVCDAACLGRNLNLALQVLEMAPHRPTVLCVNLMDEAEAKGIKLDLDALSSALGVTVVGMSARRRGEAARLGAALDRAFAAPTDLPVPLCYAPEIESAIAARGGERWRALQHLSEDPAMVDGIVSTLHARACEIASAAVSAEGDRPAATPLPMPAGIGFSPGGARPTPLCWYFSSSSFGSRWRGRITPRPGSVRCLAGPSPVCLG